MDEDRMTSFLRRRAGYCRRLAIMQRDPSIAQELRELAQRYEASLEADLPGSREISSRG